MNSKSRPTILHPVRINSQAPIPTIHRQLVYGLRDDFDSVAFFGTELENVSNSKEVLVPINCNWRQYKKGLQLLKLYLSDYDIIHTGASGWKTHPLLVRLASMQGAKHIHTHHTVTPADRDQQQRLAEYADIVTAVSPFVADWATGEFGLSNVKVIPNGVDLHRFRPDAGTTEKDRILFVGRLDARKHPEIIIKLAQEMDNIDFIIRGDGPMKEGLEQSAPANVTFLERLSVEELATEYARAMVTLCPYEKEGFGMVVIESMAAGTPVIGLNSGNLPYLINENSGRIIDNLNIHTWRDVLFSTDDTVFQPRDRAKRFSWHNVISGYSKVYKSVI